MLLSDEVAQKELLTVALRLAREEALALLQWLTVNVGD